MNGFAFHHQYDTLEKAGLAIKCKGFCMGKDYAWASQVIERNGKYYYYAAVEHD